MTAARSFLADQPRDPSRPWAPSPFGRLARTHALSVAGDAVFTTAMAGLVFFSVTQLDQARWQVAAALLFTIVPFSLAAPFLGPLIDRAHGGRKWMIFAMCLARAVVCVMLVWTRDNQLLMYPLFTLVLVFSKGYFLARGALVPATVRNDNELIRANSRLAAISGIASVVGGGLSLSLMWVAGKVGTDIGPSVSLAVGVVVYLAATFEALQLPSVAVAPAPADPTETAELHSEGIRLAAMPVAVARAVVGFITFMLAFHFKNLEELEPWPSRVGLVSCVVMAQVGFLLGAAAATRLRRLIAEEQIIVASLAMIGVAAFVSSFMSVLAGAALLAFTVGLSSNSAKQAFDSIVQRDAPDANRGRAFARFETRFQLVWVLGALVPVVLTLPPNIGFLLIAVASSTAAVGFFVSRRRLVAASRRKPSPLAGEPILIEPQPISRAFLRHRRSRLPARGATNDTTDAANVAVVPPGMATAVYDATFDLEVDHLEEEMVGADAEPTEVFPTPSPVMTPDSAAFTGTVPLTGDDPAFDTTRPVEVIAGAAHDPTVIEASPISAPPPPWSPMTTDRLSTAPPMETRPARPERWESTEPTEWAERAPTAGLVVDPMASTTDRLQMADQGIDGRPEPPRSPDRDEAARRPTDRRRGTSSGHAPRPDIDDDELGQPSDVAFFHQPPGAPRRPPDDHGQAQVSASEVWLAMPQDEADDHRDHGDDNDQDWIREDDDPFGGAWRR